MTPFYAISLRHQRDVWKGNEERLKRLAKGLLLGLKHMHQCGFAHRDIKTDNILLQNTMGDPIIIDFGLVNFAKEALRTIGFAYKDLQQGDGGNNHEDMCKDENGRDIKIAKIEESGLTLICIAGIKDCIKKFEF